VMTVWGAQSYGTDEIGVCLAIPEVAFHQPVFADGAVSTRDEFCPP
jgi:hypothetical protein